LELATVAVARSYDGGVMPRTIYLDGRKERTSLRLEPVMWEALRDIAAHEGLSMSKLVKKVNDSREATDNLSSAIRVYIVEFYRGRVMLNPSGH
jgi:predicted DNA-binding ribbon-helix-helix protein